MSESNFKARDIGMRAQKKLLSRMANKHIAKVFIDDTTGQLLDNLYRLAKAQTGNKKEAEKVVKNIIKVVIKIGILYRNDQFTAEELQLAEQFKKKFHSTAMTVASFYEVDFSFDRNYLMQSLAECSAMLKRLVQEHLTENSLNRIEHIFSLFGGATFLEEVFRRDSEHRELLGKIVVDMHKLMEEGGL